MYFFGAKTHDYPLVCVIGPFWIVSIWLCCWVRLGAEGVVIRVMGHMSFRRVATIFCASRSEDHVYCTARHASGCVFSMTLDFETFITIELSLNRN